MSFAGSCGHSEAKRSPLIEEDGVLGPGFEHEAGSLRFVFGGERRLGDGGCVGEAGRAAEDGGEGAELVVEDGEAVALLGVFTDLGARRRRRRDRGGGGLLSRLDDRFAGGGFGFEDLAGAGDSVALVVEQALDAEGCFDVALAVEALAGATFIGLS